MVADQGRHVYVLVPGVRPYSTPPVGTASSRATILVSEQNRVVLIPTDVVHSLFQEWGKRS